MVKNLSNIQTQVFKIICKDLNLNCVNTIDRLTKANENSLMPTHFPSNVHLKKYGHEEVSKIFSLKLSNL